MNTSNLHFAAPFPLPPDKVLVRDFITLTVIAEILGPFGEAKLSTIEPLGFDTVQQILITWSHVRERCPESVPAQAVPTELVWGEF